MEDNPQQPVAPYILRERDLDFRQFVMDNFIKINYIGIIKKLYFYDLNYTNNTYIIATMLLCQCYSFL